MEKITLENIEQFSIPLEEHPYKWMFKDEKEPELSNEFRDQIFPLTKEAASFLWKIESKIKIFGKEFWDHKFFKENERLPIHELSVKEVKKWLYHRGIPFDRKVFIAIQPTAGFVLTWKMVIKFADGLFWGSDQAIWDRTLNWGLVYDHNDIFYFGKNRIYNHDLESEKIAENRRIVEEAIERSKRLQTNTKKYLINPYKKL